MRSLICDPFIKIFKAPFSGMRFVFRTFYIHIAPLELLVKGAELAESPSM